jgi:DNA-binding Lrp family transcriptional regulator
VEKTVALVLIKTELGKAKQVAQAVNELDSVYWSMVVTGPYDVIAAVKVSNNLELGNLVVNQLQGVNGIKNPTTLVGTFICKGVDPFP